MLLVGLDTIELARPPIPPHKNCCLYNKYPPLLNETKARFVFSYTPNWILTRSPTPKSGGRVPM